jgi:hypothetical protein
LRINNIEFDYSIDYINRKMHLLDMEYSRKQALFNGINPDFQKRLVEAENLLQDVLTFEWICYGSDGIIAAYSNYNFKYTSPKMPYLNRAYLDIMDERRVRFKRGH